MSNANQETHGANGQDRLMAHDYDGIQEFDNPMPAWWKAIYIVSIIFAVGYYLYFYQGMGGKSIHEEYDAEVAEAQVKYAAFSLAEVKEADLEALAKDPAAVAAGKAKFAAVCVACHDQQGQGKIGPNLTDEYWIHGKGTLVDIIKVVSEGVPAKGMPTWSRQMKADEIKQVVAFVASIRNTHVAGKAPQGDKVGEPAKVLPAGGVPAPAPAPTAIPTAATPTADPAAPAAAAPAAAAPAAAAPAAVPAP